MTGNLKIPLKTNLTMQSKNTIRCHNWPAFLLNRANLNLPFSRQKKGHTEKKLSISSLRVEGLIGGFYDFFEFRKKCKR